MCTTMCTTMASTMCTIIATTMATLGTEGITHPKQQCVLRFETLPSECKCWVLPL
jgi:hypothetical protein